MATAATTREGADGLPEVPTLLERLQEIAAGLRRRGLEQEANDVDAAVERFEVLYREYRRVRHPE